MYVRYSSYTFTNPTNSTKSFADKQILIFVLPVSNKKYTSALKFSCSGSLIHFLRRACNLVGLFVHNKNMHGSMWTLKGVLWYLHSDV